MMTNLTAWMLSFTSIEKRVKASGYFTSALFLGQFSSPIIFHPLVSSLGGVQDFFFYYWIITIFYRFIYYYIFKV